MSTIQAGRTTSTRVPQPQQILENAWQLVPRLRERLGETEQLRRLPDETIKEAADAGIFSLLLPRDLGGAGGGLREFAELPRILAHGHLAAAWTLSFLVQHNFMMARMSLDAQREVFHDGQPAFMAGVIAPPGKAVTADGGYVLNGHWGYATAVMHADWIQVFATVDDGEGGSLVFLVPRGEVEVQETWNMSGMGGTGSNHVHAVDVFVPAHRTLDLDLWASRRNPGAQLHSESVYGYALRDILGFMYPAMAVGAAEVMLEEFRARIERRRQPYTQQMTIDTVTGQMRYAKAVASLRAAQATLELALQETIEANERSDVDLDPKIRAGFKLSMLSAIRLAWESVEIMLRGSGTSVFNADSSTQQYVRDLEMLLSHQTIDEDTMYAKTGEILLGRTSESISGVI